MEKFPLTQTGLTDLLNQLFSQPDAELQLQADAIANDFRTWVINHFILAENQLAYLNQVDNRFIAIAANESADFVSRRKLIHLVKNERPVSTKAEGEDPDEGKLLDLDKAKTAGYAGNGDFNESEDLTFTISYIQA